MIDLLPIINEVTDEHRIHAIHNQDEIRLGCSCGWSTSYIPITEAQSCTNSHIAPIISTKIADYISKNTEIRRAYLLQYKYANGNNYAELYETSDKALHEFTLLRDISHSTNVRHLSVVEIDLVVRREMEVARIS